MSQIKLLSWAWVFTTVRFFKEKNYVKEASVPFQILVSFTGDHWLSLINLM